MKTCDNCVWAQCNEEMEWCALIRDNGGNVCDRWYALENQIRAPEPKNNDGLEHCWWCGKSTKIILGFSSNYNYCEACQK